MNAGKGAGPGAPPPLVSIIVPAHDCRELTEACLASIARHTPLPHEVLLVDDASDAESAAAFRGLAGGTVRLLRNEQRGSFSASNNRAAAEARGKHLCLLNNDTLVTPGWLEALLEVARREAGLGVLGNKQLFPDRPGLHHAGIALDVRGFPLHLHPHGDPAAPAVNYQRDVPCVTFACVLIPAAVYRRLGGLDEAYRNGFEDCDFCLRARREGLRVIYTPASLVYHYGQRSPGRTSADDANWRLFQERWPRRERGSLERITREDREHNRRVARRPRIRPAPPEGLHLAVDLSAGNAFAWATVSLVEAILAGKERIAVSLPRCPRISPTIPRPQRRLLRPLMRGRPCGTWHVKWSHHWRQHLHQELSGEVNAELFCTNYRGGAGVHATDPWLRNVQLNGWRKLPVARFNLEALGDIGVPGRDCAVVPLGYSPEIDRLLPGLPPRGGRRERHILHVTNSHDLLRYGTDLAVRALGEAFGPGDPVVVHFRDYGAPAGGGSLRTWVAAQRSFPPTVWHEGFLPKEDLLRLYAGMDALLAPFRGEGFSMKVLDAMALGVPVLMPAFGGPTEYAAPGTFLELPWRRVPVGDCLDRASWHLSDEAWWCEPDAEALVEALRAWAADDVPALRVGAAAADHVRGRYTWAAAAERLLEALRRWSALRGVAAAVQRQPDRLPLSVVIPTRDRPEALARTLAGYATQDRPAGDYELILVNDRGDRAGLDAVVDAAGRGLPLTVLENHGPPGPAAARNEGIERARGAVVLIAGDDIVPSPGFVAAHLAGHRRFPRLEEALVGLTRWHPDLEVTPFMEHLTGAGGQQFDYRGLRDGARVTPDRFYTSNCSLKRAFLSGEPGPFSTVYPLAAYEDVELALRLHLRGLRLRYAAGAIGFHDHPTDLEGFLGRQRRAGRMLARLAIQHPALVPREHGAHLLAMEYALRRLPRLPRPALSPGADLPLVLQATERWLRDLVGAEGGGAGADPPGDGAAALSGGHAPGGTDARVWDAAGELALTVGMAEEWGRTEEDRLLLTVWAAAITMPRLAGHDDLPGRLPGFDPGGGSPALFPGSAAAFLVAHALRTSPLLGGLVTRLEGSRAGRAARQAAERLLRRR